MPKRPGSPLEAQNTRKVSRFPSETQVLPEQSVNPEDERNGQPTQVTAEASLESAETIETEDKMQKLSDLLSFEGLKTHEEIHARFHLLAHELLYNYRIRIRRQNNNTEEGNTEETGNPPENAYSDVELQLMEMEFYLIIPGVHEDPYCHGSLEQTKSGCWYFHRAPRYTTSSTVMASVGGGYRSGSRKGLDITIGSAVESSDTTRQAGTSIPQSQMPRGGILFRSARDVSTGAIVSGPSLLVDFILSKCGVDAIETLVSDEWKEDTSALNASKGNGSTPQVSIVPVTSEPSLRPDADKSFTYYTTPRIGLDLSHNTARPVAGNPRVQYVQQSYRFLVEPHLLKANGRPQMFVGLLPHMMNTLGMKLPFGLGERERLIAAIAKLGGFTPKGAQSYMQYYETGKKGGLKLLGSFCGAQGKGVCQSPEKLLQMFGALHTSGL
ncbi:hypothetical protein M408DRAFT_16457 [Serendipita vermifera MAFF 305830]|uniref:Uncharacterized protein n=1 Tax=Serendipita vermifera MAFF 305830 TaxID=933852 RepID=A0A0C2WNH3_SERVB|nr:hypothetical protein M408DRAFT_16457 [Serendipita vermifera MAFF 305830]